MPYTYLLGWPEYDRWYYGVRWAADADPNELWTVYKTSSRHVWAFAAEHGDPPTIRTRVHETPDRARSYENKVLRRLKVTTNPRWLNQTDNISISPEATMRGVEAARRAVLGTKQSSEHKEKRLSQIRGRKHTPEALAKMSATLTGKTATEETRAKMSQSHKGRPKSEETRARMKEAQLLRWAKERESA